MVSASIKVAGAGWQSCGASGKMRGKQTFAELPRGQGSPRRSPGPAVPPPAGSTPRASRPAPGSCRGENHTHHKSVHRGPGITYDGSFPLRGRRCDSLGYTYVFLSLYRGVHLVRARVCAQNTYFCPFCIRVRFNCEQHDTHLHMLAIRILIDRILPGSSFWYTNDWYSLRSARLPFLPFLPFIFTPKRRQAFKQRF